MNNLIEGVSANDTSRNVEIGKFGDGSYGIRLTNKDIWRKTPEDKLKKRISELILLAVKGRIKDIPINDPEVIRLLKKVKKDAQAREANWWLKKLEDKGEVKVKLIMPAIKKRIEFLTAEANTRISPTTWGDMEAGKSLAKIMNDYYENEDTQGIKLAKRCMKLLDRVHRVLYALKALAGKRYALYFFDLFMKYTIDPAIIELDTDPKYKELFSHTRNIMMTKKSIILIKKELTKSQQKKLKDETTKWKNR